MIGPMPLYGVKWTVRLKHVADASMMGEPDEECLKPRRAWLARQGDSKLPRCAGAVSLSRARRRIFPA